MYVQCSHELRLAWSFARFQSLYAQVQKRKRNLTVSFLGKSAFVYRLDSRQNVVLGSGLRHVGLRSRNCSLQAPTSSTVKGNVKLQSTPGRLHSSSIFPRKKIRAVAIAVANTPTTSFISFPWSSFGTQPPRLPSFSFQAV